ncbi:copper amine oxidase N-terminal domain-containing protein [Moorella sulfitireducens]|uniref:copper amine oxidase N-terminal domain-containing protein n=1 Tax=Neomoorella sulfitireducens TaxID=2972948 RepID=UPI003BF53997
MFTGTVVLTIALAAGAFGANPIKLIVNGQEIKPDVPPHLIGGRTMVPIRWVAEALGADVQWDYKNQQVTVNQPPDVWQGKLGLTAQQWIFIRNRVTRFLMAFDERNHAEGQQLVSDNFDSNLVGPEVVVPIGGFYPAIIDYKFIDAKEETDGTVRVRVEVYENGTSGLTVQNWDFLINTQSHLIEGLFVGERQSLNSHTVFQGLTIHNNQ